MTNNQYWMVKTLFEACGYKIKTKYKKNLKVVKFDDMILKKRKNEKEK